LPLDWVGPGWRRMVACPRPPRLAQL